MISGTDSPTVKLKVLPQRFKFRSLIGRGGNGEVFSVWDTQLSRTVAIKLLRADGVHAAHAHSAMQEAVRMAAIRHSNIVTVFDVGNDEGTPYIVMEHVVGETLEQRLRRGLMPLQEFTDFAEQALSGLIAAHQAGLIHRDLKPSNVMLAERPGGGFDVKILDFGLAKFQEAPALQTVAVDGTVMGTLDYIAPEQLNRDMVDHRTDLYAIGCVFYHALTGRDAFGGSNIGEVIAAHFTDNVTPIETFRSDLPSGLCEWIMRLMRQDPSARYRSAKEALEALQLVLPGYTRKILIVGRAPVPIPTATGAIVAKAGDAGETKGLRALFAALIVLILVSGYFGFRSMQEGTGKTPSDPQAGTSSVSPLATPVKEPEAVATPTRSQPTAVAASEGTNPSGTASLPAPPPVEPMSVVPSQVVLRLAGSNTIGGALVPSLVEAFLTKEGAKSVTRKQGATVEDTVVTGTFEADGKPLNRVVEIMAHGTKHAFEGLAREKCDIGMASRPAKTEEVDLCTQAGLGDIRSSASEHVVGLDGIAVFVHKSNPVSSLTKKQIGEIVSGKITDWSAVGGKAGPIRLHARDAKSGTFDTFKALVLDAGALPDSTVRYEDSNELSDAVSKDPAAIGFAGLPYIRDAKSLAVSDEGTASFLPTRFTVATEDSVLSRRLFLYTPAESRNALVAKFVEFALSDPGQSLVESVGFVKQTIDIARPVIPSSAPDDYVRAVEKAERLGLSFRFKAGQFLPDNKGLRDLDRLVGLLAQDRYKNKELWLLGFSDAQGNAAQNVKLSKSRAQTIAQALMTRGVPPKGVLGFGGVLPVASNETEDGRNKNRRVEVWVR
jgi:phosphate transport system substrate-binding protein